MIASVSAVFGAIAQAQTASDALVCANANISLEERKTFFASVSWTRNDARRKCIKLTAILLGNIDATKPETWPETKKWAESLAGAGDRGSSVSYVLDGSSVLLGKNSAGEDTCIFVSDRPFIEDLISRYPTARTFRNGTRLFATYKQEELRFTASEFIGAAKTELLTSCGNPVFTASFVTSPVYN